MKIELLDSPGSTIDENPPAKAGDMCSTPWSGKIPRASEQLSLCAATTDSACAVVPVTHKRACFAATEPGAATTETCAPNACALQQENHLNEKPAHHNRV